MSARALAAALSVYELVGRDISKDCILVSSLCPCLLVFNMRLRVWVEAFVLDEG